MSLMLFGPGGHVVCKEDDKRKKRSETVHPQKKISKNISSVPEEGED
jgi:hypothetical protein